MDDLQNKPSFFAIIKESVNTEQLRIPPKFLKYMSEDFSSDAILIGPSGNQWPVITLKKGNGIYMEQGWLQFLKDNSVMVDEFLVFTFEGENCFRVQIFGKNGCERSFTIQGKPLKAVTPSLAMAKKGRPRKTSASKSCKEELHLSNKDSLPMDSAESFASSNPYFKRVMAKSSVEKGFLLSIAADFARKYLSPAIKEIKLQNAGGKSWEVTCFYGQKHGYTMFSKGWGNFARDNKLKIGDTCIFELEGRNQMRVHIFKCAPN